MTSGPGGRGKPLLRGARPTRRDHAEAARGMPLGPRAERAHDRPAHRRRGIRAGRRGQPGGRRQARRRAGRRALPGALPVAAARGARCRRYRRVAEHVTDKLIRRHPHVFGDVEAATAGRCCATGTRSSSASPDASRACSARSPRTCPRRCTRARSSAGLPRAALTSPASRDRCSRCATSSTSSRRADTPEEHFNELGDLLFAAVNVARKLHVDPELALRSSADRFRARVDAGVELAASEGRSWNDLAA